MQTSSELIVLLQYVAAAVFAVSTATAVTSQSAAAI